MPTSRICAANAARSWCSTRLGRRRSGHGDECAEHHQGRYCSLRKRADSVSRDLLQKILDDTEEHMHFLEKQLELIEKVGLPNYLQSQMGKLS